MNYVIKVLAEVHVYPGVHNEEPGGGRGATSPPPQRFQISQSAPQKIATVIPQNHTMNDMHACTTQYL